jgi:hypothetical protein
MAGPEDLLPGDMSSGDYAVVLLAATAGFVVDAGLNVVGFLSPGYVGVTSATAALGAKKAVEGRLRRRGWRKRVTALGSHLRRRGLDAIADRLDEDYQLYAEGLMDETALSGRYGIALEELRDGS